MVNHHINLVAVEDHTFTIKLVNYSLQQVVEEGYICHKILQMVLIQYMLIINIHNNQKLKMDMVVYLDKHKQNNYIKHILLDLVVVGGILMVNLYKHSQ